MTPWFADSHTSVYAGRLEDVLPSLGEASVDSVVCDPPYELGFMGKSWDASGVAYQPGTWGHVLRVLKPGGHLLAFGGTRTYHRMAVAVEDAGFEVRDTIAWMYGSGFPKSLDVSKAIDKAAGAEREVVGTRRKLGLGGSATYAQDEWTQSQRGMIDLDVTEPATPEAEQWSGWGTALKPAHEPIVVARKPFAGTVAVNVLERGTGALNIDGCRIEYRTEADRAETAQKAKNWQDANSKGRHMDGSSYVPVRPDFEPWQQPSGRWPANVVLDPEAAAALDKQSGITTAGAAGKKGSSGFVNGYDGDYEVPYGDTGGASRFFYCAKASRTDRGTGNTHPTVKPVELMRWLVRLVTPPGGTVLDPFAGSGSTLIAATIEGRQSIGIEPEPDYLDIIRHRLTQPIAPVLDLDGGAA